MSTEPAVGFDPRTDDQLLQFLGTEADRLGHEVVAEILRRGDRMADRLAEICKRESSWRAAGKDFWVPVHASYLLGAIGGEKTLEGLLAALRHSVRHKVD